MMDWDRVRDWLDNPIFIKHVRSRLRKQPLAAGAVVVVVLCSCIVWAGYQLDAFVNGRAFEALIVLQGIILIVLGASQINAAVGGARTSGILDFHRVSPLTPTELTLGFFFGAPIREYVLFACTLPFSALFMAFGVPSLHGFVQLMIFLIAQTWMFQGLALLNALILKGHGSARGAVGAVGIAVFFVLIFVNSLRMGRFIPSVALFDEDGRLIFFRQSLPWLAVVLLYVATVLFFIFLAARRKLGSERIHPLSKPQAIAALISASVLVLGGIWQSDDYDALEIVALYLLVIAANLLILMVTPNQAEYTKGLRRAQKQGRSHLSWWDDLALNRVFLVIACAIVLVTATVARNRSAEPRAGAFVGGSVAGNLPLAIATGVLVVAYFGLAYQYFALRFGPRARTYYALFVFLAWLLPVVAGTILAMASNLGNGDMGGQILFSLSPIPGIAMIAAPGGDASYRTAIQGAAITPPLFFTFVFNSLLIAARRRHHKAFLAAAEGTIASAPKENRDGDLVVPGGVSQEIASVG